MITRKNAAILINQNTKGSIPLRATTRTHQYTDLKSVRCVFLLQVVGLVVGLCRIASKITGITFQ